MHLASHISRAFCLRRDKASGMLKGDALVTFLKEPSVGLAMQMLDGTHFRGTSGRPMTVTRAKFEMKVRASSCG